LCAFEFCCEEKGTMILGGVLCRDWYLGCNQGQILNQLFYTDLILNERMVNAFIDSGSSRNFLKEELVGELGLRVES
jgi:hypothetical protein